VITLQNSKPDRDSHSRSWISQLDTALSFWKLLWRGSRSISSVSPSILDEVIWNVFIIVNAKTLAIPSRNLAMSCCSSTAYQTYHILQDIAKYLGCSGVTTILSNKVGKCQKVWKQDKRGPEWKRSPAEQVVGFDELKSIQHRFWKSFAEPCRGLLVIPYSIPNVVASIYFALDWQELALIRYACCADKTWSEYGLQPHIEHKYPLTSKRCTRSTFNAQVLRPQDWQVRICT
jgi:hypothetical protein